MVCGSYYFTLHQAMPVTGPNSYPAAINEFLQHWTDLNTFLGAPVVLSGARPIASLSGWLTQIETKISETTTAVIAASNRKAELDVLKQDIISWSVIFNATMRSNHSDLSYVKKLVPVPNQTAGRGQFLEPVVKTEQIWSDVNNVLAEQLVLTRKTTQPNGTILTENLDFDGYGTIIAAIQSKWNVWTKAQQASENIRETRNDVMQLAYDCMRDYRLRVPLELPAGHALLDSLPKLNPEPGDAPNAPVASGSWNGTTNEADLSAVASTSPEVVRHELRYSPDDPYNSDNEIVLASIPLGQPLTFSTDIGLAVPGDISRFTWVAVTANGNEGRSEVLPITRT